MNVSVSPGFVSPGFAAFRAAYDAGRGSLVWRSGVADLDTPVAAFLKLAHGQPNSFLLESVEVKYFLKWFLINILVVVVVVIRVLLVL